MALPDLVDAIERAAAIEIHELEAAAAAEVARIEVAAERTRAERRASRTRAVTAGLEAAAGTRLAEARREARAGVLAARAAMLDRVREAVRVRLPTVLDADVGRALVADAVGCAGDATGVARCAPALVDEVRAITPAGLRVEADAGVGAGIAIELAGGVRIIATLEALLDREWPRLATTALVRIDAEVAS